MAHGDVPDIVRKRELAVPNRISRTHHAMFEYTCSALRVSGQSPLKDKHLDLFS